MKLIFCSYVIKQERIQVVALQQMVNGNEDLALNTLSEFIQQNNETLN